MGFKLNSLMAYAGEELTPTLVSPVLYKN